MGTTKLTIGDKKRLAQELILNQIANIGYGDSYEEYRKNFPSVNEGCHVLRAQMDRVAKMFGYDSSWFN